MRTVKRAFLILEVLASEARKLSLMEISAKSRLDKATCLRFLGTLEGIGLIQRDERTRLYELSPKVVLFSNAFLKAGRIEERARPYLERLVSETEETAYYTIRNGDFRVTLYLVESPHETKTLVDVGAPVPLNSGCVSRAMLAFLPENEVRRIVYRKPIPRLTPWSITDPEKIRRKLLEVRAKGYSIGIRERAPDTNAVAAPVFNSHGVVASLAIIGPSERLTRKACEKFGPVVRRLSQKLSREMGFQASDENHQGKFRRLAT